MSQRRTGLRVIGGCAPAPQAAAGNCLILLARDTWEPFLYCGDFKVGGARILYTEMNALLKQATS